MKTSLARVLRLKLVALNCCVHLCTAICARIITGIHRYYSKIHYFLPFLPHNKEVLLSTLSQTSLTVHHAFHGALLMLSYPGDFSTIPLRGSETENPKSEYARMVSDLQHDSKSTQTPVDKLVVLQTILLMIFAAELNSPATAGRHCISHLIRSYTLMNLSGYLFYDAETLQEIVDGTFKH